MYVYGERTHICKSTNNKWDNFFCPISFSRNFLEIIVFPCFFSKA